MHDEDTDTHDRIIPTYDTTTHPIKQTPSCLTTSSNVPCLLWHYCYVRKCNRMLGNNEYPKAALTVSDRVVYGKYGKPEKNGEKRSHKNPIHGYYLSYLTSPKSKPNTTDL